LGLRAVSWVALLNPVRELDLGQLRVLVGHLWVECTVVAGVKVSGHMHVRGAALPHLMLVTSVMETLLNSATFACVMPKFFASIADYTKLIAGILPIIRVGLVEKILPRPLVWLLKIVVPVGPHSF